MIFSDLYISTFLFTLLIPILIHRHIFNKGTPIILASDMVWSPLTVYLFLPSL